MHQKLVFIKQTKKLRICQFYLIAESFINNRASETTSHALNLPAMIK